MSDIRERFEFTYESGASGSFLVISADKKENILNYQVEMLANNSNKNILPFDVRQNNDKINLYYNVTSKLTLSQYLNRNKLGKNELLGIFSDIVKVILSAKDYFLYDKSFILDEEFMYINPQTVELALVYVPVKFDADINACLKEFTMKFIMYSSNIEETGNDNFLQRIMTVLKSETFNVLEFDKLLKELMSSNNNARKVNPTSKPLETNASEAKPMPTNKPAAVEIPGANQPAKATQMKAIPPQEGIPVPPKVEIPKARPDIPKPDFPKNRVQDNLSSMKLKPDAMKMGIILQVLIIVLAGIVLFSGVLKPLGNDMAANVFALVIIGGAASYFVWKKIMSGSNMMEDDAYGNTSVSKVNMGKMEIRPVRENTDAQSPASFAKNTAQTGIEAVNEESLRDIKEDKKEDFIKVNIPKVQSLEDTVMMEASIKRPPFLEGKSNGTVEEITITKSSFIIGRLPDQVDYVSRNNAVGKVHAEIITRDGSYYLKDLNSKNGSYINGERIVSGKEYEIKNNDRISFANSDYRFIVP